MASCLSVVPMEGVAKKTPVGPEVVANRLFLLMSVLAEPAFNAQCPLVSFWLPTLLLLSGEGRRSIGGHGFASG